MQTPTGTQRQDTHTCAQHFTITTHFVRDGLVIFVIVQPYTDNAPSNSETSTSETHGMEILQYAVN